MKTSFFFFLFFFSNRALQPPNWKKMWIVGVRATATNKLVGFISAIPAEIRIYDQ